MKKMIIAVLTVTVGSGLFMSCQDNHASEAKPGKKETAKKEEIKETKGKAPVKEDGAAIASIETKDYVMKLHRAFTYTPKDGGIMANWAPKKGNKFIYLDVSLRNKSAVKIDGGFIFIALKVTDKNGVEYKKPAAALAGYCSDNPQEQNQGEYDALWEKFEPNEFHREVVYAVEVPENTNEFILSLPEDNKRKVWNHLNFSL